MKLIPPVNAQESVTVPLENFVEFVSPINDLGLFISRLVNVFIYVAAAATFVYLVLGGIKWITAGSDKGKVEEAQSMIRNAVVGLVVVAVAWAIFILLDYFLGIGIAE
jgi:hypothetical protein